MDAPHRTTTPLCTTGVPAGAPSSAQEKTTLVGILTAKLLEVSLELLAGAEEDPSLLGAHHEGALLVDGDAGHLRVQLGERRALRGRTGSERLPEHPCLASPPLPLPFPSGIFFFPSKDSPIKSNVLVGVRISWVLGHPLNTLATLELQKCIWLSYALLETKNYLPIILLHFFLS